MSKRLRRGMMIVPLIGAAALTGCADSPPPAFSHDSRLVGDAFADKPTIRAYVVETTDSLFGKGPDALVVPVEAGFPDNGRLLGSLAPSAEAPSQDLALPVAHATGASLYRKHCLHCHGLTGDGEGPTAAFLYPRPRDYRRGLFKFTSTGFGNKPSRDDLRRTLLDGMDGTSMQSFSALLNPDELDRIVDYVMFLSMRGEFEQKLADEAANWDDADLDFFKEELPAEDLASMIFANWDAVQGPGAISPVPAARVPPDSQSLERGRQLFLGLATDAKLECAGCHGTRGIGDGPSWIDPETFNRYVFGGAVGPEPIAELEKVATTAQKRWGDDWGDPLRPSNLNHGRYKGGRRPIDLYYRIANGITGTPMPAHASILTNPDDIWHVVNFVLALPHDSTLLLPRPGEVVQPPASPASSVAQGPRQTLDAANN